LAFYGAWAPAVVVAASLVALNNAGLQFVQGETTPRSAGFTHEIARRIAAFGAVLRIRRTPDYSFRSDKRAPPKIAALRRWMPSCACRRFALCLALWRKTAPAIPRRSSTPSPTLRSPSPTGCAVPVQAAWCAKPSQERCLRAIDRRREACRSRRQLLLRFSAGSYGVNLLGL